MMMVMEPEVVVPIIMILSVLNTSWVAVQLRHEVIPGLVLPLLFGGVLGVPLGLYILTWPSLNDSMFKAGVGGAMIILGVFMMAGWRRPIKNQRAALLPVGFLSGVMNGSISICGPPVFLFLANQGIPKDTFRANIVTYFTLLNVVSLVLFARAGLLTGEVLSQSALFAPGLLVATYAGTRLAAHISQAVFGRITLVCVVAMGAVLLVRNTIALL